MNPNSDNFQFLMNITLLEEMIAADYVRVQKHPEAPFSIYNYTQNAQFERVWNEITIVCRGLIMDEEFKVVARPFPKFFNLGEIEGHQLPNSPFEVYEKMDGSLGILYFWEDKPYIASRGSFSSKQAIEANEMLWSKYADSIPLLDKTKTYLFEIIYPENRIVLNYGEERMLVLLAIIDTATGLDMPLAEIGFPLVKRYDGLEDISALAAMQEDNKEGFVIKFENGHRIKVKFAEYVRIHYIISHFSNRTVWEYLSEGKSMTELLERVPDEFFNWVRELHNNFLSQYKAIEEQALAEFKQFETRKEAAMYYVTCKYPAIMFKMYDAKDYSAIIWKMIYPDYAKPFSMEIEFE